MQSAKTGLASLTIVFLFLIGLTVIPTSPAQAIVNGTHASYSNWKFFAQIEQSYDRKRWWQLCGSSFITKDLLVTAKHCLKWDNYSYRAKYKVGSSFRIFEIERVHFLRPGIPSDRNNFDSDLAIIKLKQPVPSAVPIQILQRPINETNAIYKAGTGWDGVSSPRLGDLPFKEMKTNLQPINVCYNLQPYDLINPSLTRNLCLEDFDNKQKACKGDSGGPAVVETNNGRKLVGLTSFSQVACPLGRPDADFNLQDPSIIRWINSIVRRYSSATVIDNSSLALNNVNTSTLVRVPNIKGKTVSQAKRILAKSGFRLGRDVTRSSCPRLKCLVRSKRFIRSQSLSPWFKKTRGLVVHYSYYYILNYNNRR